MSLLEHDIRYSEAVDASWMHQWLQGVQGCDGYPFEGAELEEAVRNWIGFAKFKASLTAVLPDQTPCAVGTLLLMPYQKVAHHASMMLVVAPEYRHRGIGFSMVKNLVHLASHYFHLQSVQAELDPVSFPLSILKKQGFQTIFHQDKYYKLSDGSYRSRSVLECFIGGRPISSAVLKGRTDVHK
jgi:ribosomal protein S18 acetylase RimI-like enzyme